MRKRDPLRYRMQSCPREKKRKEFVEKGHGDVSSASSRRLCLRTLLNWLFGLFVVFLEDFGRHYEIVDAILFEHEGG